MLTARHRIVFSLSALLLLFGILFLSHLSCLQTKVADKVFRLHIVAGGDTPNEQSLKLRVRDRLLTDCGHLFDGCQTAEDAVAVAERNLPILKQTAEDELRHHGVLQPVSVWVGERRFPTKSYGTVRLPAGRYSSLNLRIGTGAGQNWWCVMYPPLCLSGSAVCADAETLAALRQTLTAEEYELLTDSSDLCVRFKFKLTELLGSRF